MIGRALVKLIVVKSAISVLGPEARLLGVVFWGDVVGLGDCDIVEIGPNGSISPLVLVLGGEDGDGAGGG